MSILSTRSSGTRRGSQHNRPSSLFKRFSRMSVNSQLNTEHPLTEHSEPESENDENTQIYSTEKSNDGVYTIGKHRLTVDQLNDEGGEGSIFRTSIKPPEQQSGTRSSSFGARPSSLFKCRESVNCFYFFFVVDKRWPLWLGIWWFKICVVVVVVGWLVYVVNPLPVLILSFFFLPSSSITTPQQREPCWIIFNFLWPTFVVALQF